MAVDAFRACLYGKSTFRTNPFFEIRFLLVFVPVECSLRTEESDTQSNESGKNKNSSVFHVLKSSCVVYQTCQELFSYSP